MPVPSGVQVQAAGAASFVCGVHWSSVGTRNSQGAAGDKYRKALTDLRKALFEGSEERVAELTEDLRDLMEDGPPDLLLAGSGRYSALHASWQSSLA